MCTYLLLTLTLSVVLMSGCGREAGDPRVNLGHGVGSHTAGDNYITRPIGQAVSALLGEGIEIHQIIERTTPEGFLEIQIKGYNKAYDVRRFDYRVEWVDPDGMVIPTKTSVWMPVSAMPKSEVTFQFIAPRKDAVNFTINTRKQPS